MSPHAELVFFQLMRAYVVEENDMMTQCHACHVIPHAKNKPLLGIYQETN